MRNVFWNVRECIFNFKTQVQKRSEIVGAFRYAVVAKKFSNAMDERDAKSKELLSTYQQLDDELLKRESLEASNQALARENEIAAQQLIQADKLATLGTMVAGVAHDIANPAGALISCKKTALPSLEDSPIGCAALRKVNRYINRLESLAFKTCNIC